ncbi:hypothetical protein [Sphingomonas sp. DC2300-3]|uniref:hypothetical protein n=1 Tax=unclassified Sphingomonas TaxID=196159 RepID=UPI003CFB2E44
MRGVRIVLFALVWLSCVWFGSWERNDNQATRMYAAIGLVERGDASIDPYATLTIDKAMFGGRTYLDKPPGMTLMALPAVWIADRVTGDRASHYDSAIGGYDFDRYLRLRVRLAVAMGPALLTALAAVLLFDLGVGLSGSASAGLFAALGYALGTPVWGWSTTLLGHAVVADLYVVAIWAVWRGLSLPRGASGHALLAGVALGWAVVVEHQAVLAGAVIALWAAWAARERADRAWLIGAALIGGAIALVPFATYNLVAFGTPFRIGYAGVVGWEGMHQGLFGLGVPRLSVLREVTIGARYGLVWVAPVLVLAPYGLWMWGQRPRTCSLAVAAALAAIVVLLVNAAYVYWQGGNTTGPRFAIPAVPSLAMGLAAAWAHAGDRSIRIGMALLLALSIAINAAIASAEIFAPPGSAFPVWQAVIAGPFANGVLRTMPSEWFGLSPWAGFRWWCALALPMLGWLAWRVRRVQA